MKLSILSVAVFLAVAPASAWPVPAAAYEVDGLDVLEVEPVDLDMVRRPDGTLIVRESYMQADGSKVQRTTIQKTLKKEALPVELSPSQRRLIWDTVALPSAAGRPGETERLDPAPAREHIEAVPGLKSYPIGARIPMPSALQPLPDTVTLAVPSVQDHLYTLAGGRILVVEPATNTVVAEVVR